MIKLSQRTNQQRERILTPRNNNQRNIEPLRGGKMSNRRAEVAFLKIAKLYKCHDLSIHEKQKTKVLYFSSCKNLEEFECGCSY